MKIILINPGNNLDRQFGRYAAAMQPVVPTGLAYLAACLRRSGHEVSIIDHYATREPISTLVHNVVQQKPDIVGLSVLTPATTAATRISLAIRASSPSIRIVWGNIHARVFADDILRDGLADAIVHQEGEETMVEYVTHLQTGTPLDNVKGLSFRGDDGLPVHMPLRPPIADLDTLPYPAFDLLDIKRYVAPPFLGWMEPILPVQASRGCQFHCTYCSQENMAHGLRFRNMKAVVDEMEYHHHRFGIRYMGFLDANFPFDREHALEFAEEYMSRGMHRKVKWLTETRVDLIDDEVMGVLARAGLRLIMFGFESGTQHMLDSYRKRVQLDTAFRAMASARRWKVAVLGLFMLGMPGETRASAAATLRTALKLDPDFAKFNLAVPYPGCEFFEEWRRTHPGLIDFARFSSWLDKSDADDLLYRPEGMTGEELIGLRDQAMRKFYLRPGFVLRHLRNGTLQGRGMARGLSVFVVGWARSEFRHRRGRAVSGMRERDRC